MGRRGDPQGPPQGVARWLTECMDALPAGLARAIDGNGRGRAMDGKGYPARGPTTGRDTPGGGPPDAGCPRAALSSVEKIRSPEI